MSESISNNFLCLHYENKQKKRPAKETRNIVFFYFMGRLANDIVYKNIKAISEFDLNACHNLDFVYVAQALKENDLNNCLSMMRNSTFIKKANKIIQQI